MFREARYGPEEGPALKLTGGTIVIFYLITSELPANHNIAFWSWFVLTIGVILEG